MLARFFSWLKRQFENQPGVENVKEQVVPLATVPKSPYPTRDQVSDILNGLILGSIPTRIGIRYSDIRETHGKNRSPAIDLIIKNQGGVLGDPYCQWGVQEVLDQLCIELKIKRSNVPIPKGGSTQMVWNAIPQKYKRRLPSALHWVTWQNKSNPGRGHVGICLGEVLRDNSFRTFEFNTTVMIDDVVRDGEGAFFVTRRLNDTQTMRLLGFTDIYEAICDAIDAEAKTNV